VSLVCGSCAEREKASVESGRPGAVGQYDGRREGVCQRRKPEALSTGCGACWRTGL
jgi:hypothetical protein